MIPARAQPNKRKLTPLLVQRLRRQARAYLVWDTVQRGLALRVEPAGYMAHEIAYRRHKKQLRSAT